MYDIIVFPTNRKIREFIEKAPDGKLPKLFTIEEFISNIIVVPGKTKIDNIRRIFFLKEAVSCIDKEQIVKLGIPEDFYSFVKFIKKSDFFFKFFEEIAVEKVNFEKLKEFDIYTDFQDHLVILEKILKNYKKILNKNNFYDKITLEYYHYQLNKKFIERINSITIFVEGYLSKFEQELFSQIPNLKISFIKTPFNNKLIKIFNNDSFALNKRYLLDYKEKTIIEESPIDVNLKTKCYKVSQRLYQVAVILKEVDEMVKNGILPEKIAVIIPDENFKDFLNYFDNVDGKRNFNYAMGISFTQLNLYKKLKKLYEYSVAGKEEGFAKNYEEFILFIKEQGNEILNRDERVKFDEAIFKFEKIIQNIKNITTIELLYLLLVYLEDISIDDTSGGKITVMGVLESRGMQFDGVIIVDFNEGIVPHISEKDIFLNTFIKKQAGLPTKYDRENLQKHYYYTLIAGAKYSTVVFVDNEEKKPSRFLNELGIGQHIIDADNFIDGILPFSSLKKHFFYNNKIITDKNEMFCNKKITPTKLKNYLECKRRYYFLYQKELKYEDTDENIGSLIHKAIETYSSINIDATNYFNKIMEFLNEKLVTNMERLELELWSSRLKTFTKLDAERLNKVSRIKKEEWGECYFSDYKLSAKIDRIEENGDSVTFLDFKTTKDENLPIRKGKLKENTTDFQLLFYYLIGKRLYPDKNIIVGYFSIYSGRFIEVDVKEDIEIFKNIILEIPELENFEANYKSCYYCDYKTLCGV